MLLRLSTWIVHCIVRPLISRISTTISDIDAVIPHLYPILTQGRIVRICWRRVVIEIFWHSLQLIIRCPIHCAVGLSCSESLLLNVEQFILIMLMLKSSFKLYVFLQSFMFLFEAYEVFQFLLELLNLCFLFAGFASMKLQLCLIVFILSI